MAWVAAFPNPTHQPAQKAKLPVATSETPKRKIQTVTERRKKAHEDVVDDILAIAREMMQADGVAALSFNGIARRLGIKPPSLYTYFDNKHAIYDTLFRKGWAQFSDELRQKIVRDEGMETFFRTSIIAYMTFSLENPDLFELMFQRPIPGFVPSDESLQVSFGALHELRHTLETVLTENDTSIRKPIEQTSDLIISLIYGMIALQLANDPAPSVGEGRFGGLIENAVQLLMRALT